jgi:single-stranded DNA-binding protein
MSGIEAAFFGTLGRDAERKVSASGKPYLPLNVRVGDQDGAQWVNAMAFDQNAIDMADRFIKGAKVYIEGRLSVTEWTGQDGKQRHGLSCMAWHCRLSQIGRQKSKPARHKPAPVKKDEAAQGARGQSNAFFSDEVPFAPEVR